MSLSQYYLNITEHNAAMWGRDWKAEDLDGRNPTEIAAESRREWMQEKCMSGDVMAKPMTLPELHAAVRALLPPKFTVFTDLSLKNYSHRPDEMDVIVSVWIHGPRVDGPGHAVDGDTCEQVLAKVKAVVLPALGLVDVPPAEERLQAMGV